MTVERKMREALERRSTMRREREAIKEKSLKSAVGDVLDGTCESAADAARGRGLSADTVREAVKAARAQKADR